MTLTEMDFKEMSAIVGLTNFDPCPEVIRFVAWELRSSREHGTLAGQWLVVSPEFEEEIAGPFATRAECDRCIYELETARAEAHADPYPERLYPEAEMN